METNLLNCQDSIMIKGFDVLPFLLDLPPDKIKKGMIKPSQIMRALKLTTEERLEAEKTRSLTGKYKHGSKKDAFHRCPEAIIFQNFQIGQIYETTLTVTNQRSVAKNLKVFFETSRFFTISMDSKKGMLQKFAPGMSSTFKITFLPTDIERDFAHFIRFVSDDNSEFTVPIYAIGPRPVALMPDKITLPSTLVKVESSHTIVLRNSGRKDLDYTLLIDFPFSCSIHKGILPPNGILEAKYSCYSVKPGLITGIAKIYVWNDFFLTVDLECDVKTVKVNLDPQFITFDDVYVGLCNRKIINLYNSSDYPLNFAWKMNDHDDERVKITKLAQLMEEMKEYEQKRYEKLEYLNIVDGENHKQIYERIFIDEISDLMKKHTFLFRSDFFQLIPRVGKVLPKSKFEFSVIFAPKENILYNSFAYLDVEGTHKRVRLSLQGFGIGPPVMLTVKNINAGQIYLTDKHQYQLALTNKGVIPATVKYLPKKTDWGGILACIPESMILESDTTKAFLIVFSSKVQGEFIETIDFRVQESKEEFQCTFTGNVICPLLKCFPDSVDFGTVSVGENCIKEVILQNDSRVNIAFDFEFEYASDKTRFGRFFKIIPQHGHVLAFTKLTIQMIFCSDTISNWKTHLLLIMWQSRLYTTKISVKAICACPKITCDPEIINIKFCFLNCEYTRIIKLQNQSDSPGYVEFISQDSIDENEAIECEPNEKKIYFTGHQTIQLEVKIKVSKLGLHQLPLNFSIIGGMSHTLCSISCNGQGPVVSYFPDELDFGVIEVLHTYQKKLSLTNDSPISAKIKIYCKSGTLFYIAESDENIELLPEEETEITVWALFNAPGSYKDTIFIQIYQGDLSEIPVYGEGEGTSILCEPPLSPSLNFGIQLTYKRFVQEIKLTNKGNHRHKLLITKRNNVRSLKESPEDMEGNIFNIKPNYFEIEPNKSSTISITASTKKPKTVIEEYFCYALIGKSPIIQTIIQFILEADFVDPALNFSQKDVNFSLEVINSRAEGTTEEIIQVDNNTGIPLQIYFTMADEEDNFTFVDGENSSSSTTTKTRHDLNRTSMVSIFYNPTIKDRRRQSQRARLIVEYENHPKTDIINLHGEIMFPTIKLYPDEINFLCVPLGSTSYRVIVIQNVSAMVVNFKWYWLEKHFIVTNLNVQKETSRSIKLDTNFFISENFMNYIDIKCSDINKPQEYTPTHQSITSERIVLPDQEAQNYYSYDSKKYLENMKNVLSAVLAPYKNHQSDTESLLLEPMNKNCIKDSMKMLTLEPSQGTLKPNEYTIITVGFNPLPNTELTAQAICRVEGGAEEELLITGKSSRLSYKMNKNSVNFGTQLFCENSTDYFVLSNTSLCTIDYKISTEEIINLYGHILEVSPRCGSIPPGAEVSYKIDYFPGCPGNFNKSFILELGYLEPVMIHVHGYAVPSQVFLRVPRLEFNLKITDSYQAIGWITQEYLELIGGRNESDFNDFPNDPRNFLTDNDWVYVSYNDCYPSTVDIDMAMERIIAFYHINNNPRILKEHTALKKITNIPDYEVTPYLIDFGYVIRDIPVCYTVMIENYGPINADIKLLENNKTALLEQEIKIEFNKSTKSFAPGESIPLYVVFAPTKRKCMDLNKKIENFFKLSVKHGAIITVQIKAIVTLPVVSLQHEELFFKQVYCGDCLRKTIILYNNGNVESKWFASVIRPNKKNEITNFFIIPSEGKLDAGQEAFLDIYFVPSDIHKINRTLRINVESNEEPLYMYLHGEGVEASLMVMPPELNFGPILSYFEQTLYFAVQNMSEIPMEFHFPTFDSENEREEQLIQAYLKIKNLKSVFIPQIVPGQSLPEFFATTYYCLLEKLRHKLWNLYYNGEEGAEEEGEEELVNEDPLAKYSPKELNILLHDFITEENYDDDCFTNSTIYRLDEGVEKVEIVDAVPKIFEELDRQAAIFIFHGAPNTDYCRAAHQVSIELSIPVYSVDRLIIEALVENLHPIAQDLLQIIDESFETLIDPKSNNLLENLELEENKYDQILEKINVILTTKPKKGKNKGSPKEKGNSKVSSEKSQGKNKEKSPSAGSGDGFLGISLDGLTDLLRTKLKKIPYIVVESLNNTFIRQPIQTLYALLKAVGSINFINITLLSATLEDYVKNQENLLPQAVQEETKTDNSTTQPVKSKSGKSTARSEKTSKSSAKGAADKTKKILQSLPKAFKVQLDEFKDFRNEVYHIVQYWDNKSGFLRKPFNSGNIIKKEGSTKESARTVRSSGKKVASISNLEDATPEPLIDFWLMLNTFKDREIDYAQILRNYISENDDLKKILADIEKSFVKKLEEHETLFSVISKPTGQKNEESTVFTIKNYYGNEINFNGKTKSKSSSAGSLRSVKRRRSSKGSRKSIDSKMSTTSKNGNLQESLPYFRADNELEFSSKIILQPGDISRFQITFHPNKCGVFKNKYSIECTKNSKNYSISCNAQCEYPQIDLNPENMFPKTLENYREKASYDHFVFIKDQNIFDFGSIIAMPQDKPQIIYTTSMRLKNISSTICEVTITINNDSIFNLESSGFVIAPTCEKTLKISAKSSKIGTFTAELFISIKNNPRIETFTLACSPCKLEFSIYPRNVTFDKVPLNYAAKRIVRLTNTTPINLRWEFVDSERIYEIFELSHNHGLMGLYSVTDVVFKFRPLEEMSLPKNHLTIKVYDVNSANADECFTENLTIHADSVEYNLDLDEHLDYGEIKGGYDNKKLFPITNKGKCEIALKIELISNPLEIQNFVREYFKIHPLTMIIGAQKTENLSIIFHPNSNFSINNALIFVVSMVESLETGHVIKSYKVFISATSYMPSFQLCPHSRLSFGYVPLQTIKKLTLEITNDGKFSFSFTILNYTKILEALSNKAKVSGKKKNKAADGADTSQKSSAKSSKSGKTEKKTKTSSKGSSSKNEKKKAIKLTKLDIGAFSIFPSTGIVSPGEKFVIEVHVTPQETHQYKEEILIRLDEIDDIMKNRRLILFATGCEPKINLHDYSNIFAEQQQVSVIEDFIIPKNAGIGEIVVFAADDHSLHFKRICLNSSKITHLFFKNIGFVSSHLNAKIEDGGRNSFTVIPANITIEPYSSNFISVIFKPVSLDAVHGILEITYNSSVDNRLIISLFGEVCLPQISLLNPLSQNDLLSFGPTCIGFSEIKYLSFKNTGPIDCKVIVEIKSNEKNHFTFIPIGDTLEKLNLKCEEKSDLEDFMMKPNTVINLLIDESAVFQIIYKPTVQEITEAIIQLHTVRNPYEILKVQIVAESFDNPIIMQGLEPTRISSKKSSIISKNSIGYHLDMGYKKLHRLYKISFLIKNRSKIDTYKFRFYCSSMMFIPEVGHLKPEAFKEILVVFNANAPITLNRTEIACNINKIEYVNSDNINEEDLLSWDDRRKFIYLITDPQASSLSVDGISQISLTANTDKSTVTINEEKNKSYLDSMTFKEDETIIKPSIKTKVIMEGTEPEFITIPESFDIIPIYLTVSADYCKYECDTKIVDFTPILINEEVHEKITVKNTGNVLLSITWQIITARISSKRASSATDIFTHRFFEDRSLKSASTLSVFSASSSDSPELELPFKIKPEKSEILPQESLEFTLTFCPKKVEQIQVNLQSSIEALSSDTEEISIPVTGSALPIPFFFELEPGLNSNKDIELKFESVGTATELTKELMLVNASDSVLTFIIIPKNELEFSSFTCSKSKGYIKPNKKAPISFTFSPSILGSFHEDYQLKLSEIDFSRLISIKGLCREPKVFFFSNIIKMKPTLPTVKSCEIVKLRNDETFPVSFKFIKKSFYNDSQYEKIDVYPIVGKLRPQFEQEIKLTFKTQNVISTCFNVKCLIEKLKSPLSLNISVKSLQVESKVSFVDSEGEIVYLQENADNIIDIGGIFKGRKSQTKFNIMNNGETGLFFSWNFDTKYVGHLFKISVDKEKDFIKSKKSCPVNFNIESIRTGNLKQFKVSLNIQYGSNYLIFFNGSSEKLNYVFSFNTYDFGYCIVQNGHTDYYSTILTFKNLDSKKIILQNTYEGSDKISINFDSSEVSPGEVKPILIKFHPNYEGVFQEKLIFFVGGIQHPILIKGEAVKIKLELCHPRDKNINFGEILINTTKKYRLSVMNNSAAKVQVHFNLYDNLFIHNKKIDKLDSGIKIPVLPPIIEPKKGKGKNKDDGKKSPKSAASKGKADKKNEKNKKDEEKLIAEAKAAEELLKRELELRKEYLKSFEIASNMSIDLAPKSVTSIDIVVKPTFKMNFEEKIYFEIQDYFEPLCLIKGSSVVPSFSLNRKEIFFAGVIVGCVTSQFITLRNTGDITGSFTWSIEEKNPVFTIEPMKGFVLPKNDIKIKITFSPKVEKCEFFTKARCVVKEFKDYLNLNIKGKSIRMPESLGTINLKCIVREKVVDQSINVLNNTLEQWIIKTECFPEMFSTPKEILIPFSSSVIVPVTYLPKKMTNTTPDTGSLFIKFPDGNGQFYKLMGTASPPQVKKRFEKEIACKQNHFEQIPLENWLTIKQTFKVITEVVSPLTAKTLFKVFGFKTIELKGSELYYYKWGVYLFNEGPLEFRVTFKNPSSGEYEYFEFSYKVLASEPIDIISLNAKARETVCKQFLLENPVDIPVVYTLDCSEKYLTFPKTVNLQPYTSYKVDLIYNPVLTENVCGTLIAKCEELGSYMYLLKMHSEAPKEEPVINFISELGWKTRKFITFKNHFDKAVEFSFKCNNPEFYLERYNNIIAPGDTHKMSVIFEPSELGHLTSKLFLTSLVAGEYM